MFRISLKRDGQEVGDLGEYDDLEEAQEIVKTFNTKPSRRGVLAELQQVKKNPSSLGSLFGDFEDREYSEESESDYEEESIYTDADSSMEVYDEAHHQAYDEAHQPQEDSEEYSTEKMNVYRNPMDLWPIHKPKRTYTAPKTVERRESITKNRKRISRKFKAPHTMSVQAIMIDDDGYVLIRKPSNRYRGIKWEFYGGKVEGGEDIEQALRREMLEETGYTILLVDKIGDISLDGGIQKYFLISPQKQTQEPTMETENTFWVSQDEAWNQLGKNKEPYKRKLRSILDKAYSIWRRHNV